LAEAVEEAPRYCNDWASSRRALVYFQGAVEVGVLVYDVERVRKVAFLFLSEVARAEVEEFVNVIVKGKELLIGFSLSENTVCILIHEMIFQATSDIGISVQNDWAEILVRASHHHSMGFLQGAKAVALVGQEIIACTSSVEGALETEAKTVEAKRDIFINLAWRWVPVRFDVELWFEGFIIVEGVMVFDGEVSFYVDVS
jgi:hypothetical protein